MKKTLKVFKKIRVSVLTLALILVFGLCGPLQLTALADVVVTANNNTYIAGNGYQYVDPTLTLTGSGTVTGAKVYFGSEFVAYQDYLSYSGSNYGLSASYASSTGVLTISGTSDITTYQAFLRSVTYNNSSATSGTKTVYFSVSQSSTSTYYYSGTGHFYEYVSGRLDWDSAAAAAVNRTITVNNTTYNGYLVTITSAGENSFVAQKCAGNGWIGASDEASEDVWRWVTGPEAGTQFWQGNGSQAGGYAVNGMYSNWANSEEPNDAYQSVGEDHAHMYSDGGGLERLLQVLYLGNLRLPGRVWNILY